jgi:hypothetical protein
MRGAIPPLPQYALMAWCSVKKAQGQLYILTYGGLQTPPLFLPLLSWEDFRPSSCVNINHLCASGCRHPCFLFSWEHRYCINLWSSFVYLVFL